MPKTPQPRPRFPYLYLPDGWDTAWVAAKAAIGSAPANVSILGDSIAVGQNAGATYLTNFPSVLKIKLLAALGTTLAQEYISCWHSTDAFFGAITGGPYGAASVGAPTLVATTNWHRSWQQATTGSVAWQTFTTPYACTAIDIFTADVNPGAWTYNVDGGGTQTVTNTGGGTPGTAFVRKTSITGLANSTHTLNFLGQTLANCLVILGVTCYPSGAAPSSGLGLARLVAGGGAMMEITAPNGTQIFPADRTGLFTNKSPQSDSGVIATPFGFPVRCDLAILNYGVNDCNNAGAIAAYTAPNFQIAYQRVIDAMRRATPNCSIILLAPFYGTLYSDNATGLANQGIWSSYLTTMQAIAAANSCALINLSSRWGSTPNARGYTGTADVHPTQAGHADIAAAIMSVL